MNSKLLMTVGMFSMPLTFDAHAGIVSTSGAAKVVSPPSDVRTGKLENDTTIPVFPEQEGVTASQAISADITKPGRSPDSSGRRNISPGVIPAGTRISSYYIHHDKVGGGDVIKSAAGSVTFSEPVLGLIVSDGGLGATNAFPGLPGTTYGGGQVEIRTPDAFIMLSEDLKTVSFNLVVTTASDDIRVITGNSSSSQNNGVTGTPGGVGQTGGSGQTGFGFLSNLCGAGGPGLGLVTAMMLMTRVSARRYPRFRGATGRKVHRPFRKQ